MLVGILVVMNFPVDVLLRKLFLPGSDVTSVLETSVAVLWRLMIEPVVRLFVYVDDAVLEMSWGEFVRMLLFLGCCVLVVWGEYWLFEKLW